MMKYMKSIMDVLVSCLLARREPAIIVLFTRSDECRGGWAGCDFNQAYFYLRVINMHGRGNRRKGRGRNEVGENE